MWSTTAGDTLVLPRAWIDRFAAKLADAGLTHPGAHSGDVYNTLSRLTENAYRAGSLRHRPSGRVYPVFGSTISGRNFRVITRPINDRLSAVLDVQTELDFEDTKDIPKPIYKLVDYVNLLPQPGEIYSGVYFIFRDGKLIYIGKALNFRRRLQEHYWCMRHMAVEDGYMRRYFVSFMKLPATTNKDREKIRQTESDLIKKYRGRRTKTIDITNQRTELEIWGESWI